MKKDENFQERFEKVLPELSADVKTGLYWLIRNYLAIEMTCQQVHLSNETLQQLKKDARARNEYHLLALLCAIESFQEDRA